MPGIKRFKLLDLVMDRVDLCGAGANPDSHIMMYKSKEDDVAQPKKKAKTPAKKKAAGRADSRSKSKQRGDEEEEEDEDDAVTKSEDDEDDDEEVDDEDDEGVEKSDDDEEDEDEDADELEDEEDDEPPAKKSKVKKPAKKPTKKAAAADDVDEDLEDDVDEDDADVEEIPAKTLKSLPASLRRIIEQNTLIAKRAARQAREATEAAEAERVRRETVEYVEKAKERFPNLPGTDAQKGGVLQAIYSSKMAKEVRKHLIQMLKAGDGALQMHFAESGRPSRGGDDDDSPLAQLTEIAEEIREADKTGTMSKSQAFAKACDRNPKLYNEYRTAKRRMVADA